MYAIVIVITNMYLYKHTYRLYVFNSDEDIRLHNKNSLRNL